MARVYEVTAKVASATADGEDKPLLGYGGSQGEASALKKEWLEKHKDAGLKRSAITIEEIDVPTNKKELIGWLNKQFGQN